MKTLVRTCFCIIATMVLLSGCDKAGTITHRVKYTTETFGLKSDATKSGELHGGFGDYITSLTPYQFSAKMNVMCYQDLWNHKDDACHMISYIDGHDNDPNFEIALYADFSGNKEVSIVPILYSTDKWEGVFLTDQVTMHYFCFVPYYIELEVELPVEYKDKGLDQFVEGLSYEAQSGRVLLKATTNPFEMPIFRQINPTITQVPFGYVFGGTDSTYVYNKSGYVITDPDEYPFSDSSRPVVRSNKYTPVTVQMPDPGESFEMYSTISYNTTNIIQVYSGTDKVPYTSDDVFVFSPKYWERINVKLEVR